MYVKVHVIVESPSEAVVEKEGVLFVSVREKAERNMANRRMLELVRARFGKHSRLRIVSGHHSPHKIISVDQQEE